jgi:transcriptional regulator with XRE-family HTH domain
MAKSKERNKALGLRKKGASIKEIAKKLKIAKSTISLWCRDIELTPEQIQHLHERMIRGGYKGCLKGARIQYERRLEREKELKQQGLNMIDRMSARDFLIAGVALYWGEGQKKGREVRISNSDPEIIKFMLRWFKVIWGVSNNEITLSVLINKIHKKRVKEVENYWSRITKIPKERFVKTVLIKAKNKKIYNNFSTYYGTLTIRLKNPTNLHHRIIGMIEGLSGAG